MFAESLDEMDDSREVVQQLVDEYHAARYSHHQCCGSEMFILDSGIEVFSVADPDPRVFGPPGSGSGSISQRYRSGSGSFYH
jgi:hypothetical protein